jgi:diguanylate cyclase (GGDEF)-like protein
MTLRWRLTLAFVTVVLVPMVVGAVLVTQALPSSVQARQMDAVATDARLVAQMLRETCERARTTAEAAGRLATTTSPAQARAAAESFVQRGLVDVISVLAPSGRPVLTVGAPPASAADCATGGGQGLYLAASVPLLTAAGQDAGRAVVSVAVRPGLLTRLEGVLGGVDVALVSAGGTVVASSAGLEPAAVRAAFDHPAGVVVGDLVTAGLGAGPGQPFGVVVSEPSEQGSGLLVDAVVVVVIALLGAVGIALVVARATTRPLAELGEAATRVAAGDLSTVIEVRSKDELGRLAASFNTMTYDLRTYVDQLRGSRDELRNGLGRLGETLAGSHDLDRILHVVLESAISATRASGGMVLLRSKGRDDLSLAASQGIEVPLDLTLPLGQGVSGQVALTGEPLRGRVGHGPGELWPAVGEPTGTSCIAVPLRSSGRVVGVLDLFGSALPAGFDDDDLATMRTFASQATVAVDNVLLHEEAQRLAVTDGLTGLWNYRYFTMTMTKELERAARFGRPMALLMLDLDHFKDVNDSFGHQRGDDVLVEFAARVRAEARDVDTVARYGGEEVVLVLPETDETGARQAAERICAAVRRKPFGGPGVPPVRLTVSAGVAVYPTHGTTASALLKGADGALYEAKHAGRDTYRVTPGSAAG